MQLPILLVSASPQNLAFVSYRLCRIYADAPNPPKANRVILERTQTTPLRSTDELAQARPSTGTANTVIDLDCSAISELHEDKDVYRWAIIYENQRGYAFHICPCNFAEHLIQFLFSITIFSTAYYSGLSLLPSDPLPFTIPCSSAKRSKQPKVSLTEYPLPDGTWRWVSKTWMIDMRSDSGEVQHDGFEYNWRFRQNNWNSEVGTLSIGGWVRRRRWVRLMMRPAQATVEEKAAVVCPGALRQGIQSTQACRNIK
jgi:hypothetical protein